MTDEVREREIAVMKVQLQVLEEWLQEQENQNRGWIFPLRGKRMIWRQLQRRLRQIVIALLKKELRVLEPEMEFEDSTRRFVQKDVLEEAVKTGKSCGFKTDKLCVFAGAVQGDEKVLEFVQEELNLKAVQINDEMTRSQEEMKMKESTQNVGVEREKPADDWLRSGEGMENHVKFPSFIPNEVVELYRKLDLQRRELERQRTYVQIICWESKAGKFS